ncbi:hypothetical protein J6Z48_00875, partial [bacterium]|nr:hypothetical protein [bacterium]
MERLEKSHKGWETAVSIAAENYEEACGNPIVFTATECVERYAEMAEAKYQECATKIALLKEKLRVETLDKLEREAIKEELEEAEKRLDNLKKRAEAARGKATQPKADEAEGKADKPEADKAEGKADKPEADKAEGKADKPEADKAEGKPNWTRILLFIAVILITAMLLRQCAPQLKSLWQQSQTRQQLQYEQQIQEMQLLQQLKQQRIDPVVQEQQPTTRRGEANEGNFVKSVSIQDWYDTNIYDPVIWMTGVDPSAYIGQAPDPMLDALGI